jgi:hypothetical protein
MPMNRAAVKGENTQKSCGRPVSARSRVSSPHGIHRTLGGWTTHRNSARVWTERPGVLEGSLCAAFGPCAVPAWCERVATALLQDCDGIASVLFPWVSLVHPLYIPCTSLVSLGHFPGASVALPRTLRSPYVASRETRPGFDGICLAAIQTSSHFSVHLLPPLSFGLGTLACKAQSHGRPNSIDTFARDATMSSIHETPYALGTNRSVG